jgi:hypothetical protein
VDEYPFDVVAATELFLAFDVAKSALVQAEERAQLAVATLLSAFFRRRRRRRRASAA